MLGKVGTHKPCRFDSLLTQSHHHTYGFFIINLWAFWKIIKHQNLTPKSCKINVKRSLTEDHFYW